ncbi:hypothetical protein [Corynebacterium variabile]|uniref:hypothetical protein n=1 Tax=Corynebacterium variabile TaxID=1727 RepID=UPI0028997D53|nr:hypothetical protein [Corynebacterium variabile]
MGEVETIGGWQVHPAASWFPMSPDETLNVLAEDITKNGLREPIVFGQYWPDPYEVLRAHGVEIEDGSDIEGVDFGEEVNAALSTPELVLLDGRNRLTACLRAGVEPAFETHIPGDTLQRDSDSDDWEEFVVGWIMSKNLHRRHLSTGERAAVAARYVQFFEEDAKKRMLATQNNNAGRAAVANLPQQGSAGKKSREQAADMFNVSARTVATAKKVLEEAPDLYQKVERGEMAPSRAEKILKERTATPPTPQEVAAAQEAMIQKMAERNAKRCMREFGKEGLVLYMHYFHLETEGLNA